MMRSAFVLLSLTLAAGCPDSEREPPASVDAGSEAGADASPIRDAGTLPRDAGSSEDAATPTPDAGMSPPGPVIDGPWLVYRPGLAVGVFDAPVPSIVGDSEIHVVRVDPAHFDFRLVARGELLETSKTVPEWVATQGLVGAINASMYAADHRTSVFYMRNGDYVNNGTWHSSGNAVFASRPTDPTMPGARLVDRTCDDTPTIEAGYLTLVQNYRMLTCDGASAWSDREEIYCIASVGADSAGRILFIHSRSPYSVHDLTLMLLELPLDLQRLMYVEGGPEASLYVEHAGEPIVSRVGSYETGFWERDDNHEFWPVPNVIGFFGRD